ncbi:hypothetical protein [Sorangium sp. So ce362]|uniref:hypothetical protein n=1 Tax=Sorangium sp. So ce362 TaxID=3133303 RepID=UPI003F5FCBB0
MRTRAAAELEAWAETRGGQRAAARELAIPSATLSRWITGVRTPVPGAELSPAWIEARTGVAAAGWDVLAAPPSPPSPPSPPLEKASKGRRAPSPPPVAPSPPVPPGKVAKVRQRLPVAGASTPSPPVPVAPPVPPVEPEPPEPPASLDELKRRARAIPGELRRLRGRVEGGGVSVSAAETIRRLLTDERAAAIAAIESDGTATVAEVEQLRALVLDVTRGCEACRSRVLSALKEHAP